MLFPSQIAEMRARIETSIANEGESALANDARTLLLEVNRLGALNESFTQNLMARVDAWSDDMESLENENVRLRRNTESTYFERDACVGLIARLARIQGFRVGKGKFEVAETASDGSTGIQVQNRVVVDLPSGQVSWEYFDAEAHLFAELPEYGQPLLIQTVGEAYTKVMNPDLSFSVSDADQLRT